MKKNVEESKNKKQYSKPTLEVAEFRFSEHIAASGSSCYWGASEAWTHAFVGCRDQVTPGPEGWINNLG